MRSSAILCLFLLLLLALPAASEAPFPAPGTRVVLLRDRLEERKDLAVQWDAVRKALAEGGRLAPEEKLRLERESARLAEELRKAEEGLRLELTGVQEVPVANGEELDLQKQFRQVLRPALDFLDDLMKQPREIDELRRGLARRDQEIPELQRALDGLKATVTEIAAATDPSANADVLQEVAKLDTEYRRQLESRKAERISLQRRLDEMMSQRRGFGHYAANLWSGYVLQRLLNLVMAIAAVAGMFALLSWLHGWIGRRGLRKKLGLSALVVRSFDVIYYALSGLVSLAAGFLVLWLSGDWLLLTLAMLLVAGLVLLSRRTLPHFYDQARLLLNLGPVREGERVIFRGLPWLVRRLHFHCELQNPSLTGGLLHLPLRELGALTSRAFSPRERWFPCEEGEWVELNDGTIGKVVLQTPEMVQVLPVGGSFKSYPAADFLTRTPRNLSHNFRVSVRFLLDHRHAREAEDEIPERLAADVRAAVEEEMGPEHLLHVTVELSEASPAALEMVVIADFNGSAAPHYQKLQRLLRRTCAVSARKAGWTLPIRQVVMLHDQNPAA
jgi:hypothetical protein